tara:strand:- start:136 stop:288 length:153 start_codon:yes stop_codon:yes gene_type:complete
MLIANGSIGEAIIIRKIYEVKHLTYFPDVNAKNPFMHVSLVEEKNGNFFN